MKPLQLATDTTNEQGGRDEEVHCPSLNTYSLNMIYLNKIQKQT